MFDDFCIQLLLSQIIHLSPFIRYSSYNFTEYVPLEYDTFLKYSLIE
jgi:hypothetical protein